MRVGKYVGFGAALALLCGSGLAQAAVSPADSLQGPLVNGVCMLSRQAVFAHAKVGVAASTRLQQLANGAQNRFDADRAKLSDDARAFQQQAKSLSDADRQSQEAALNQRARQLEIERQQDVQQLELTRAEVMNRIGVATQPVLATIYRAHGCGLLLDRNAVLGGNLGNDLTPAVIQGLDAKLTTISFNLSPLPAAANAH